MGTFSAWSIFLVVSLLAVKVLSQEFGDFDLSDALDDGDVTKAPAAATPKPKPVPSGADLDLSDFFGEGDKITTTKAPSKVPPKIPATKAPLKPKPKPAGDEFDLSDALDPKNDIGGKDKNKGQADKGIGGGGKGAGASNNRGGNGGGSFSDDDLFDVGKDNTYNPDKGKGGRNGGPSTADDNNYDTMAETGTIAGIVSAVGVALVGAVTSYISYQKKKFCFSIQQSLNADLVKTDNPDAVVATEPQVQQTLLEPPNAEPLVRRTLSNTPQFCLVPQPTHMHKQRGHDNTHLPAPTLWNISLHLTHTHTHTQHTTFE
ncbi:CD99 antigen-like protein 2 isoform X3 [Oncorhynchus tshawytscha]|uniref:CD99 antigen-like protein 2 isoform X3 n=1 Tax=Oncorhynchus tshawytscha TaxID=74940 RepID=UPI001C3CF674|nr:CD99 antigen-like protein 2 isoform X3 [Oncorhynchus tshawytscha]